MVISRPVAVFLMLAHTPVEGNVGGLIPIPSSSRKRGSPGRVFPWLQVSRFRENDGPWWLPPLDVGNCQHLDFDLAVGGFEPRESADRFPHQRAGDRGHPADVGILDARFVGVDNADGFPPP